MPQRRLTGGYFLPDLRDLSLVVFAHLYSRCLQQRRRERLRNRNIRIALRALYNSIVHWMASETDCSK